MSCVESFCIPDRSLCGSYKQNCCENWNWEEARSSVGVVMVVVVVKPSALTTLGFKEVTMQIGISGG